MPFRATSLVYDICSAMTPRKITLRACAKINIGLDVLRKRPDGFHDIQSMFVAIDLHDTVSIERSDAFEFECQPPVTDSPNENIVVRAAQAYKAAFPNDCVTTKITVEKSIPTGGGLGGGSSDAASTLIGLALFNERTIDDALLTTLQPIAAILGSDVPFFLQYGVAHVQGRGEQISYLPTSFPWTILLVCPGLHVNTASAYSTLGITCEQPYGDMVSAWSQAIEKQLLTSFDFTNRFEEPVFAQHPVLASIKSALYDHDAHYASMSGSGSTMYGLYTSVEKAVQAQSAFVGMTTYICHPVSESDRYV